MTTALQINVTQQAGRVPVTVFQLEGDLDASTFVQLQNQAAAALEAGTRHLVLDFSRVHYISSAGLRAIYAISKMLSAKSAGDPASNGRVGVFKSPHLKVLNPSPNVRNALNVMGFDMTLEIHSALEAAVASF